MMKESRAFAELVADIECSIESGCLMFKFTELHLAYT
jgi:hypothetical protein